MSHPVTSVRSALALSALAAFTLAACKSSDPATNGTIPASARTGTPPAGAPRPDATPVTTASATTDPARAQAGDSTRKGGGPATDSTAHRLLQRADRARIQGDAAAPIWVIVASDFQCPYCQMWHAETYPILVKDYVQTGKIRLDVASLGLDSR